jgi:uncharacterized protein YbjT (DUF2867 family)
VIVVAGGTGTLGTLVVRRLVARGLGVRVLSRDASRASHLAGPGVEVVEGDVRDAASVVRAMAGGDTVVSLIHGFAGPGHVSPATVDRQGNANLVDAAASAGAAFILMSVVDASLESPFELFRAKYQAEEQLRASGVAWTIVRATAFVETWATIMGEPLRTKGKAMVFGRGDNPINFVSALDVAQLVELAVIDPALRGQTLELGGPDDVTFNEFAATLRLVTGWGNGARNIPRPALRAMATVMKVLKPAFARQAAAAVLMDTRDMTFDAGPTRRAFPALATTDVTTALKTWLNSREAPPPA